MGCGSVLGDLLYLADSWRLSPGPGAALQSQASRPLVSLWAGGDLLSDLYKMHGEGHINEEVFGALRALADRGQLRPADLAVHRARTQRRPGHREHPPVENAMRAVRSRLDQLAGARKSSEKVLSDLQARMADVDRRMTSKLNTARGAVGMGDEQAARRQLTEKAQLSSSRDRLAKQLQLLEVDLARLDDLTAQLQNKSAELEAVRARGDLASLGRVEGNQEKG